MNRNVSLGQGVAILTLFLLMLWGVFWANGKAVEQRGFSHLHHHPNGNLFIMLGARLFEHDRRGNPVGEYDLAAMQITSKPGDFAFFANGDLLIRRGEPERSFWHNFQRFFRLTNSKPAVVEDGTAALMRCQLPKGVCSPFPQTPLDLSDSHYLEVDWETGRVFIADSTRHRLYMLSPEGAILGTVGSGLIFPNRIVYKQERLYVANTDKLEVTVFSVTDQGFAPEPKHMAMMVPVTILHGEFWPASVAFIGERLWVEIAKKGMRDGGIYLVRADGSFDRRVDLPADADPFAMAEIDDRVLVTDFSRDRIYEVSTDGKLFGEFKSSAMQPVVDEIQQTRGFYRMVRWGFVGLFFFAFGIGFAVALRLERKAAAESPGGLPGLKPRAQRVGLPGRAASTPEGAPKVVVQGPPRVQGSATPGRMLNPGELELLRRDKRVVWMEPSEAVLKRLNWVLLAIGGFWVLFAALTFEGFWAQLLARNPLQGGFMIAYIPLVILAFGYSFRKLRNLRIGTYQDLVIVVDRQARAAVGKGGQIDYSERFLAIGDVVVPLRTGVIGLFDDFMLVSHLHPRLSAANPLPLSEAVARQLKTQFPFNRTR